MSEKHLLPFERSAVAGLAQRPRRSLLRAKTAICINSTSCATKIDNDIEAVFPALETVACGRLNIDLIHAGAERQVPLLTGQIVAFTNRNFGFAFAVSVQKKAYFPASNPLSLDDRVGRYVEILDSYSVSAPAFKPAPISFCGI
jgi:hypothetical protein